jgi:hypothetical protein
MVFGVGVGIAIFIILKNLLLICGLYYLFSLLSNYINEEIKEETNKIKEQTNKIKKETKKYI